MNRKEFPNTSCSKAGIKIHPSDNDVNTNANVNANNIFLSFISFPLSWSKFLLKFHIIHKLFLSTRISIKCSFEYCGLSQ